MFWGNETSVIFPNLGIELENLPRGISLFGFNIALYGIIIGIGMICGILIARSQAKRTKQNPDFYLDFAILAIPLGVIGARIYSVVFEWEKYENDFWSIFNLRQGGLAIYGGVIAAILTVLIFCKIKKFSFGLFADTGIPGLILGQIIGRWGNFFNRECFGNYTNSLFAMRIDVADRSLASVFKPASIPDELLAQMYEGKEKALESIMEIRNNIVTVGDRSYIQVQPTFLYESVWNLAVLIVMLIYLPRKKFNGEILLIYLSGYGLGRFFIEGVRTDQLFLWNSGIAVSQALSLVLFVVSVALIVVFRIMAKKGKMPVFDQEAFFVKYNEKQNKVKTKGSETKEHVIAAENEVIKTVAGVDEDDIPGVDTIVSDSSGTEETVQTAQETVQTAQESVMSSESGETDK